MSPAARLVDIIAFVTVFFMGAFDISAEYEVRFKLCLFVMRLFVMRDAG